MKISRRSMLAGVAAFAALPITGLPKKKPQYVALPEENCATVGKMWVPPNIFVRPEDFGAKGNGKTDDTVAMRRTVDFASRLSGQLKDTETSVSVLLTGTYVMSEVVDVKGSVDMRGFGPDRSSIVYRS